MNMTPEEFIQTRCCDENGKIIRDTITIDEAQVILKLARASNQWINVKDKMPPIHDNVLLLINGIPVLGLGENVNDKCLGIEYWAIIPELPKGK